MSNLQTKISIRFRFSSPLASIPLALWSMGTLKTLLTPNASDIVVISFFLVWVLLNEVLMEIGKGCLVMDLKCLGYCVSTLIL